ncbi:riboflavin synthase [Salinisphaera orenii]|uniref:Riboflavin synthase n=1 Tax=Salinisphaera orenii YIM 95161 TaxID=1051139 RepID=A0A423PS53_9GAMM|nr:riboflavin synthase [Salinisphaera halophila]ROO28413.1 riboflavin synthase subunit alpha [Salinisphaera halophila YIM 95161]
MFTGIIKGIGIVAEIEPVGGDTRLVIDTGDADLGSIALGDSIAVSGVCLTATALDGRRFAADVSQETLSLTTLGALAVGSRVNLEAALRAGEPLGGHLVSGHVDGFGTLAEKTADARSWRLVFTVPVALSRFFAAKGSVCVDGISLTVNEVEDDRFGVNIVPHTMAHTTLGEREVGDRVNLEIDVIARYLARLVDAR